MRTLNLTLLFFVAVCFISFGQKYYTINSGNWNNTTNVWSLNGVTPCGCNPGNSLSADSIIIGHSINMGANINVDNSSNIFIKASGSLSNPSNNLTINNSTVLSYGILVIKELIINADATLELNSSSIIVNNRIHVYGIFKTVFSNITQLSGNANVWQSGTFILDQHSRLYFNSGSFSNWGLTSICSDCCISSDQGNIINELTGTMVGEGSVIATDGNVKNYHIFDPNLRWCSNDLEYGMVSPENCPLANEMCTAAPLPTEVISFEGYRSDDQNILEWQTASESNTDYFSIEKSWNGNDWIMIGTIDASGNTSNLTDYSFKDSEQKTGIVYYRLTQFDNDGKNGASEMLSLTNNSSNELFVFPNPTDENTTVQLQKNHSFKTIKIMDSYGRVLKIIEINDKLKIDIQLPDQNGFYFIKAENENEQSTFTLVKM